MKETIAAISTPMGSGAMAVVRLSGEKALEITLRLTGRQSLKNRYAHLCQIYDEGCLLDEVIVLYFAAPKSYTREDVCEIQCHGGNILARSILQLCLKYGARLAKSGEFTKRAFLNGRISFDQVEAISHLITAQSKQASKILASQMKGSLGIFIQECRDKLLEALSFSEVMIDYSEEEIPGDTIHRLGVQIETLCARFHEILEFSKLRHVLLEGISLCIIGKPNVGKSSLLNALLTQERAIVSDIAGTTRDSIESYLNIEGQMVKIIDTAGIRESGDRIESIGIERSLKAMAESDVILAVFDASSKADWEDFQIMEHLSELEDKKIVILLNKMDLARNFDTSILEGVKKDLFMELSTIDAGRILHLKDELAKLLRSFALPEGEILLCSDHQVDCIKLAFQALTQAQARLGTLELELFSYHIKETLDALSSLVRPYRVDEMLDKMFREFCLGK